MNQETKAPQVTNVESIPDFGKMEVRTSSKLPEPPNPQQISRAWTYYQQADNLQHQRHAVFIVAQSIFFAAFTQAPTPLRYTVAVVGTLLCVMWFYLAERLSDGMTELSKEYLEKDDVYVAYLNGLKRKKTVTGRFILNKALPSLMFFAWAVLIALLILGMLPPPH